MSLRIHIGEYQHETQIDCSGGTVAGGHDRKIMKLLEGGGEESEVIRRDDSQLPADHAAPIELGVRPPLSREEVEKTIGEYCSDNEIEIFYDSIPEQQQHSLAA